MDNIIAFPTKARVASNDSNPWLSSERLLAENPVNTEAVETPIYAKPCKVVDKISGVEYMGFAIEDEKKHGSRAWLFILAVIGWLILFFLV